MVTFKKKKKLLKLCSQSCDREGLGFQSDSSNKIWRLIFIFDWNEEAFNCVHAFADVFPI